MGSVDFYQIIPFSLIIIQRTVRFTSLYNQFIIHLVIVNLYAVYTYSYTKVILFAYLVIKTGLMFITIYVN